MTGCVQEFGKDLGVAQGVIAYSNCNNTYVSWEETYIRANGKEVFAGIMWQCVEYARRYLIQTKGVAFEQKDYAANIWDITSVTSVSNDQVYPLVNFPNGMVLTDQPFYYPKIGDMIIYPIQDQGMDVGHVAVVVGANATDILIGEQNWDNNVWGDKKYARALKLDCVTGGNCTLFDPGYQIYGWQRVLK